jgi:hypothetical protein
MVCFCAHRAESRQFEMLGQVPKWTKGADCKSVAIGFQGSNPCLPTILSLLEPGPLTSRKPKSYVPNDLVVYSVRQSTALRAPWSDHALACDFSACGRSSVVEFQPSKLAVRGSNPLARSISWRHVKRYSLNVKEGGQGPLGLENNESRLTINEARPT